MKKILCALLALSSCLALSACGGNKTDNQKKETEGAATTITTTGTQTTTTSDAIPARVKAEVEAFVASFADTSGYAIGVDRQYITYTAKYTPDYPFARKITLDGQTLSFPYSFTDLAALGWQSSNDTQMIDAPNNYGTITNYNGVNCPLTKGDNKEITAELFNYNNEAAPLSACRGARICLNYRPVFSRAAPEFVICGINKQDTLTQIVEKMGIPSEIEFSYYASDRSYKITFEKGEACLTVRATEDGTVTALYYEYK